MKTKTLCPYLILLLLLGVCVSVYQAASAQAEPVIIKLTPADKAGGLPLMEALAKRKSDRGLAAKALSEKELSNLLWAATGVNRASGYWTIPTAKNKQEVSVYAITDTGVYRYLPREHALEEISPGDKRPQLNIKGALELVVVMDEAKAVRPGQPALDNAAISAGTIAQNVYLYCASANLGTVVKKTSEPGVLAILAEALKLSPQQKIITVQPVGYLN